LASTFNETSTTGSVEIGTGALGTVIIQVNGASADIVFNSAVLLRDASNLQGSGSNSDISFLKTLRSVGAKDLTLSNVNGAVLFQDNVGDNTQPLGNIQLTSAVTTITDTKTSGVFNATSFVMTTPSTGAIDLSLANVLLTGASGLSLSSNTTKGWVW
jgi:hypothetical protein